MPKPTSIAFQSVTLFIVRHASAGVRGSLSSHDSERPLDAVGRDQSGAIADLLAGYPIESLYSSPALRCQQTLGPLSTKLGLLVEARTELFEGASTARSMQFIRSLQGRDVVVCSHGDVIPDILRNLEVGGTRLEGRGCAKGSIWQMDNTTDRIETGVYLGLISKAS